MASAKLSPRQRMINMMYLVLTAMLALNVSAEILKAFAMINKSLEETSQSVGQKNEALYKAFDDRMEKEPGKAKANYDKAQIIRKQTKVLLKFVQDTKNEMIDLGGNQNQKVDERDFKFEGGARRVVDDGNVDISSRVLVNPEGKSPKGLKFKELINEYRATISKMISKSDRKKIKLYLDEAKDFDAGNGVRKNWLQSNFGEMPLSGVITLLSKYESDIRNTETEVISYLLSQIDAASYKFDKVEAKVVARSSYVLTGQDYEADILLVAYDSRQDLDIRLEGGSQVPVEAGMGKLKVRATSEGERKWGGFINVVSPTTGELTRYPFSSAYTVARPAAVVSPDKMNVLYVGVDNPVSISAPGVVPENIVPGISGGGTITGSKGKYIVRVNSPGMNVNIDVRGKSVDGKGSQMLGSTLFRVKAVPDPQATIGGLTPGTVSVSQFKAQGGMIANLKDFDFDMRFDVISFRMLYFAARKDVEPLANTGAIYNAKLQQIIRNSKAGDRFIFDEVKVVGPDKITRKLPPAVYSIN
jgi:gliding motility-associated protein GldM